MRETRFKHTDVGVIPVDWEVFNVGKDCSIKARIGWQGLTTAEYLEHGEYGLITSTDIVDGKVNWKSCVFVSKDRYAQDTNIVVKDNDVLISKDGTIGKIAVVSDMPFPSTLNSGVFVVRTNNDNVSQIGLGLAFSSSYFKDFIRRLTAGSTIVHLYQKDIVNFCFPLPPVREQEQIAKVLSDVDALIASYDKLIAKKQAIKQGVMQQLLTGKKRLKGFNEPWVEKRMGELASDIRTGKRNGNEQVENGKYPFFVRSADVFRINEYSYDGEAILIPGEGGIGKIFHYINGKFDFHQRVYKISEFGDNDAKFVYYYISKFFGEYSKTLSVKATVDSLRLSAFTDFPMCIPKEKDEQRAIATILTDMDNEIGALQRKKAKYEVLKQGMMQQLLTGRIRLLVNEEDNVQSSTTNTPNIALQPNDYPKKQEDDSPKMVADQQNL